jgi:hypothetical protein
MVSAGDYDSTVTDLCERMLVTVIGNAGFWRRRLYLVGGLVPRYLYADAGGEAPAHVGSRDVDLAVILMADDPGSKSYETLARNLLNAGFRQAPDDDDPAVPGFCRAVSIDEIRKHGHFLTPGRYVGAADVEEDDEPFDEKIRRLTATLRDQQAEAARLDDAILRNLKALGYDD